MTKIFVSKLCPDCSEIIKDSQENPKKYENIEIIDITESMANLKRFLAYRDSEEAFKKKIKTNQVGIPVKIDDKKDINFL